jgi:hypothetical protein
LVVDAAPKMAPIPAFDRCQRSADQSKTASEVNQLSLIRSGTETMAAAG